MWLLNPSRDHLTNLLEHARQVIKDHIVLKPQHHESPLPQIRIPNRVVFSSCWRFMHSTVQFDNNSSRNSAEVNNVPINRFLPLELHALKLMSPQRIPKQSLGWSRPLPIFSSQIGQVGTRHEFHFRTCVVMAQITCPQPRCTAPSPRNSLRSFRPSPVSNGRGWLEPKREPGEGLHRENNDVPINPDSGGSL
jgi:hypothetical protein